MEKMNDWTVDIIILRVYAQDRGTAGEKNDGERFDKKNSRAEESYCQLSIKKSNTYRVHDQGGREIEGDR